MESLTKKQLQVLEFVKAEIREKGYPPSVREICEAVELSSTSSVHAHLNSLMEKGYIRKSKQKNRSIEVLEKEFYKSKKEIAELPIVGTVTAGTPILAEENVEDIFPLPVDFLKGRNEHFMLRVRGDSMIGRGINSGDLVIVRQQNTAENGEVVVALIDDSATVKTFYREQDYIRLQPENSAYMPIFVKEMSVLGIVVGLFRKF